MKNLSLHTPSFIERCRVLAVAALLSSPALVSPALYAQTNEGQDKFSSVPTELQIGLMPTQSTDQLRLAIANPRNTKIHIRVLDRRGRSYYEGYERGEKLIVPFNFSGAAPGLYTIDVSTSSGRQTQTFLLEPPKPKRLLPMTDALGKLTTDARVGQ